MCGLCAHQSVCLRVCECVVCVISGLEINYIFFIMIVNQCFQIDQDYKLFW